MALSSGPLPGPNLMWVVSRSELELEHLKRMLGFSSKAMTAVRSVQSDWSVMVRTMLLADGDWWM